MTTITNSVGYAEPIATNDEHEPRTDLAVLFGIPVDNMSMDQTIDRISDFVQVGRCLGRRHQITTVNVDFLVNAVEHDDLFAILQRSALNLPDGMPVVWGSRWVGTQLTGRVPGADLVPRLIEESATQGWRVHFFGGSVEVTDRAAQWVAERHPNALVSFDPGPVIDDIDDVSDCVIESIKNVDADIVCVGLGNPKQERFIAAYGERIGAPVMIGTGGSLHLLTGEKRRAPKWVQNTGLEWVFRAAQEPKRLGRRYLRDARIFAPHIGTYVPRARRHRRGASALVVAVDDGLSVRFGNIDCHTSAPSWRTTPQGASPRSLHIDFNGVTSLDPIAHSTLISVLRLARRNDARVTYQNRDPALDTCLRHYGTHSLVEDVLASVERTEPIDQSILTPPRRAVPVDDTARPMTLSGVGGARSDHAADWR